MKLKSEFLSPALGMNRKNKVEFYFFFFFFEGAEEFERTLNLCLFELEWEQTISSMAVGVPDSSVEMHYTMLFEFFICGLKLPLLS